MIGRARFWAIVFAVAVAAVAALIAVPGLASPDRAAGPAARASGHSSLRAHRAARPTAAAPAPVEITVQAATGLAVPHSFLGLSTEYWTLPVARRYLSLYERVLSLLEVPGSGPFLLRIGGDSSDHAFYLPRARKMPRWMFGLTPAWLTQAASIVRTLGLHVILDLNMITGTSRSAAAWARAAEAVLPRRSIVGYEIGNEPDLYSRAYWMGETDDNRFGGRVLPTDMTPTGYVRDYRTYARALERVAPHTPLLGPALSHPDKSSRWISTLVAGAHPDLGTVTGHRYPYSACSFHGSPSYPTIARLLSDNASAGVARSVGKAVAIARRAGLQFRLTELNSVTCGGVAGVSNTFATALWFPDAAFELARAGVQGINLHARLNAINGPFAFNARGLVARPLLYGMLMFARTLGPDSQVVPLGLHAGRRADVKAWAVRIGGDQLRTLVINKGPAPVRATLRLPATTTATVQRLLAPSVHSRFGVTIGGQWLDAHGIWRGKRVTQAIAPSWSGSYELTMRGYSAALVTVQLPSPA